MLTPMILLMIIMFMVIMLNLTKNFYFFGVSLFFLSFFFISNVNFFVSWYMISFGFSLNFYSLGLILLTLWIMGLVFMMLKDELELLSCLNLLSFTLLIMIINFYTVNVLIFYFMFEVSLLMMFLLIMKWGRGVLRLMASYYLMFYTLFFSLPFLVMMMLMLNEYGIDGFLLFELESMDLDTMMFLYFIMTFLVKMPVFLLHHWLLKAHVEAPVYGSMILAGIMLKLGSYGLLRFMMIFSDKFNELGCVLIEYGILGSIILSFLCFRQVDMKALVAMSSVVHMNFMLSSMMTLSMIGMLGAYMIMVAHGLCSSGLFYILNFSYQYSNSRLMIINKGVMICSPIMSLMWFLMCSSNMAAPLSLNLVGEIFMLISLVCYLKIICFELFFYCLLSFMYSLYLFSYVNHGELNFNLMMSGKMINYLISLFHWIPLNLMIFNLFIF
uniref:NADH-ubiquinone oxidoreductase chain 4 n=1 Tax=Coelioxys fenestrata TaxID=621226 RepID=A0A7T4WNZ7_9HYME|nr:NADH dehydrogenase subunit 4 [Coelioxys fenestrata]QQD78151.1 NADH dehydrogenase subunit 4 [Coelioxys fenestrata]